VGSNGGGCQTWRSLPVANDNAIVDGDFAVTEDQLQPVLKELLEDKINIVAIHQHMAHEEPRIMFFHYWGSGVAKDLANAVKDGFWLVACSRSVRRFKTERSLLRASPSERQEIDCTLPSNHS
jgi:hypothetical protein